MIKSIRAVRSVLTVAFAAVSFFLAFQPLQAQSASDFSREPDATISTKSLSDLPKDILSVPILKDLLTEDFVFYYRDSGANWMSFRGALARIAFEKEIDWPIQLLAWLLKSPAEIALWKSADGKLDQFMVVIDQTGVKALTEAIAKSAVADTQLSTRNVDGRVVTVFKLSNEHEVFLASEGGRLFVFSDASMKIPGEALGRTYLERAKSFFGTSAQIGLFGPKLNGANHVVTVSASYLSFGYQAFFKTIRALRFDFKGKEWSAQALTSGRALTIGEADWSIQPRGAALCVAVPIENEKIGTIVNAKEWLAKAGGSATACWYAESKFFAPLIALRGDYASMMPRAQELKPVFSKLIGSREAYWSMPETEVEGAVSVLKWKTTLPISETAVSGGGFAWSREVGGRYGLNVTAKSKLADKLTSSRYFRVKFAVTPKALIFSPDDKLVDKALTTVEGKFPSMAASLGASTKSASLILVPAALAKLAKQSVLESLPQASEAIFRTSVSRHLLPNLDRAAKRPMQTATVQDASASPAPTWKKIEWTTHAGR